MRQRWIAALATTAVLAGALPVASALAQDECAAPAPEPLAFGERVVIDPDRAGGEPVSVVAHDGSINVSAHAGTTHIYKDPDALPGAEDFAQGYYNQVLNWRSTDGGRSWSYVGLGGTQVGPHSLTSTGFSDPDYAIDQAGTIYNTEIDLANVAVFSSTDDGQSYTIANPEVTSGDRPWLVAAEPGEVFLYVNTGQQLLHSTDGGVTWTVVGVNAGREIPGLTRIPITSKPYNDPLNPDDGLIGPAGRTGIAITGDDGATWEVFGDNGLGGGTQFFGSMAVDRAGNAYMAQAGGYDGADDTEADGFVSFNAFDRERMAWGEPVQIPIPAGDAMWPWLVAGDDGRVGVAWYQNHAGAPEQFYAYVAYTLNGTGSVVDCDGVATRVPPRFAVANASGTPIHDGPICLEGTYCNALTDFAAGDRRLGDFFTVNFDADGRLFIASGDTTYPNPLGGPKPVGNPIFIGATRGTPLLETPMPTRGTRCVAPFDGTPLCGS